MEDILQELGLAEYTNRLTSEGFDNWGTLLDITESDLIELGFKIGHRRKLQRAILGSKAPSVADASALPALARSGRETTGSKGTETHEHTSSSKSEDRMSTNRPKRRYKRHPKVDKNAPCRPLSAYVLFSNDVRDKHKREGNELNFSDMAKVVGEQWQSIPSEEREKYEQSAAAQKADYNSLLNQYKKTENFREYEKYHADFKALHAQGRSGDGPSDDEGAVTKKTRLGHEVSNESRLSLDLSKQGSNGESVTSPHSVTSGSDITYNFEYQPNYGTSPTERTTHGTVPQSPSVASSSGTNHKSSSAGRRDSIRHYKPHADSSASAPELSPAFQTYGGLPNYAPSTNSAGPSPRSACSVSSYPNLRQQGPPSASFERMAATPPSSAMHMSYRTLPPPIPSTRTPAGASQPSHYQQSKPRSHDDNLQTLIAAAEMAEVRRI